MFRVGLSCSHRVSRIEVRHSRPESITPLILNLTMEKKATAALNPEKEVKLGANLTEDGCAFLVWAPRVEKLEVNLLGKRNRSLPLTRNAQGYHFGEISEVRAGMKYSLRLDGKQDRPDPASRFQPEGVHGPSEVVSANFPWEDGDWRNLPLRDYIIYELHVGTFTELGSFEGVISRLQDLKRLGVTAIELMPVAQFPGSRNWGYDGVGLFAVQNSYGGPEGLRKLVNACHREGLAVILDVVYNHLGPEGNYLGEFAPYFTEAYNTPWGAALNFDSAHSAEVRRFFTENALYWQREFHIDALRLDAVHSIRDFSALPFLQEMARATKRQAAALNRPFYLIAETDLNAPRFVLPEVAGGYGLDAQWNDDFHHCLHVLLTGERRGYYADFGKVGQFAKVFREGYAYTGEYSRHRKARHGANPVLVRPKQLVVCAQNHDQIGNRATGERLTALVDFESLKVAAGGVLLSPFIPMLYMGEEHAETAPFQYMVSHTDPELVEAVRKGRRAEFASFGWADDVPDPQAESTFVRSRINHGLREEGKHKVMFEFYRELIRLRKKHRLILEVAKDDIAVQSFEREKVLVVQYGLEGEPQLLLILAFGNGAAEVRAEVGEGSWQQIMDSSDQRWNGPGARMPGRFEANVGMEMRLHGPLVALYGRI